MATLSSVMAGERRGGAQRAALAVRAFLALATCLLTLAWLLAETAGRGASPLLAPALAAATALGGGAAGGLAALWLAARGAPAGRGRGSR